VATKKRSYHHGDLRRVLLEASIELIRERGLDDLSLREVARRAGVSPAAPYHHFETRQELLVALALDGFTMLAVATAKARDEAASDDPIDRFAAIGHAYIRFALEHPAHFRLMFRPSLVPQGALPSDGAPGEAFAVLVDAVAAVLEDERLRAHVDAPGLVLLAWSQVHGAAELLLDGPLAIGLPEFQISAADVPSRIIGATCTTLKALRSALPQPKPVRRPGSKQRRPR
jgi:AcrR family transcriptional regulator